MLETVSSLEGNVLSARDGEIGRCRDVLFDDEHWTVRYVVVDTGTWQAGASVLISPISIGRRRADADHLPVDLTRTQIENAPPLDSDAPVSRQYEKAWLDHFGYGYYWTGGDVWGAYAHPDRLIPDSPPAEPEVEPAPTGDAHLRSANEVTGYRIHARDGDIGHVRDFVLDEATWTIRYLVIDTRHWLRGHDVIVSPQWATEIDWVESKVHFDLTREEIRGSRPLEGLDIQREYEESLHQHYGKPRYWV